MAALPNCPLDPNTWLQLARPMGLSHLEAIENHFSTDNCPHPPLKEFIFYGHLGGTTPLLLACHYGELESVKRIVESWEVDVQSAATYYLHPSHAVTKKIEKASPLFVAAFEGHGKIVRYLLEKGADMTVKTSSNKANPKFDGLTPLHGAGFVHWIRQNRRFSLSEQRAERHAIVLSLLEFGADISASYQKPLWDSSWYGVDTTMTLINRGLNLKQRDPYLKTTILHHWANPLHDFTEEDALKMVKFLIEKGADVMARDNFGFTPIMIAAKGFGSRLFLTLLDLLLERDDIDIMEKIEAMELAGAKILFSAANALLFHKAFDYWRRATHLRQTEGSGSYEKELNLKSPVTVEWTTSDQLEQIIQHSTEYEVIKIQSSLVQLRILSSRSWEAVYYFFIGVFTDSDLKDLANEGKYLELLDIYWARLDTILLFQPSEVIILDLWNESVSVVGSLIRTLSNLKSSNPAVFNLEILQKSIDLILATKQLHPADLERVMGMYSLAMFEFLTMLLDLPLLLLDDIRGSLDQLFRHLGSDKLESLLLLACKDYENAHYFVIIRVLLKLGANVDTADTDGNRPLHLVAFSDSEQSGATGCLLMGYGAQLFCTNNAGKTAVDLWIERNENNNQEGEGGAAEPLDLPDWCRTVPKLLCLSARCIRVNNVPYENEWEFFKDSHDFIKKH